MGQKVNPTGLRIGVIKNWESRWYANKSNFGDTLVSDYELREYLLETLAPAGVPKVEIERDAKRVRINIHCAKPGMVIGRQGAEIEKLKETCKKMLGGDKEVFINIVEVKQPFRSGVHMVRERGHPYKFEIPKFKLGLWHLLAS